jgi:hypothetical protein
MMGEGKVNREVDGILRTFRTCLFAFSELPEFPISFGAPLLNLLPLQPNPFITAT